MVEDATHLATLSAVGERKYVENVLLCFIKEVIMHHKINFIVHNYIILFCSDFYGVMKFLKRGK